MLWFITGAPKQPYSGIRRLVYTYDYMYGGLADTVCSPENNNIGYIGITDSKSDCGSGRVYEIRGRRIGLLAYNLFEPEEAYDTNEGHVSTNEIDYVIKKSQAVPKQNALQ